MTAASSPAATSLSSPLAAVTVADVTPYIESAVDLVRRFLVLAEDFLLAQALACAHDGSSRESGRRSARTAAAATVTTTSSSTATTTTTTSTGQCTVILSPPKQLLDAVAQIGGVSVDGGGVVGSAERAVGGGGDWKTCADDDDSKASCGAPVGQQSAPPAVRDVLQGVAHRVLDRGLSYLVSVVVRRGTVCWTEAYRTWWVHRAHSRMCSCERVRLRFRLR